MRTIPSDETQLVCAYLASIRLPYFGQTVDNEDSEFGENSRQEFQVSLVSPPPHNRVWFPKVFIV